MSESKAQTTLFGVLFLGGIPLLMGSAAFYFTSGVTFRCERNAGGPVMCTEARRIFKLVDIPIRRYQDVRGAVAEPRQAHDEDGNSYTRAVPILLTKSGRFELAPSGAGASLEALVEQVDAYAKNPTPQGLSFGSQAGGFLFFFHLFSTIFIYSGIWTFGGYLAHLFGRLRQG